MRTFTIGQSGVVSEEDLIETMEGYATLFTTLRPDDSQKACARFQQIHVQLREQGLTNLIDELAEILIQVLEKIVDRGNVEPYLEEPFMLLAQLGSSRATPFFLKIISQPGNDDELLFKREMAAEKLVLLNDPNIPDELATIARGKGAFSRSRRRVAVWALGQLDTPKAREALKTLREDDGVKDLIKNP